LSGLFVMSLPAPFKGYFIANEVDMIAEKAGDIVLAEAMRWSGQFSAKARSGSANCVTRE